MKRRIIAATAVLGLGAVTFALAQPRTEMPPPQATRSVPIADNACEGDSTDSNELHARVAELRAEVELLQLEHDATRALLSDRMKSVVVANTETIGEIDDFKIASYYMRMGAEKVGKAAEFDKAIEDDRAAIEKASEKAREVPTELNRKKEAFRKLSIELNQKKIKLVEMETKLEGSM
ncbi:MAG: hypothetical protein ACLQGP_25880 [Isosphaeraceae bacterium]